MKHLLYTVLFFFLFCFEGFAQKSDLSSDLGIVVFPTQSAEIAPVFKNKMDAKVNRAFAKNGVYNLRGSVFGAFPEFHILETGKIEGMANMTTYKGELTITVKNLLTGAVFTSFAQTLTGAGKNQRAAMNITVNSFKGTSSSFKKELIQLREKMTAYYQEECENLLASAEIFISNKEYKKAIAYLSAIPAQVDCYEAAQPKLQQSYSAFQKQNCSNLLLKAEMANKRGKNTEALRYIEMMGVDSPCRQETTYLLQRIEASIETKNKQKFQFLAKAYKDNLLLKRATIESQAAIGSAYFHALGSTTKR